MISAAAWARVAVAVGVTAPFSSPSTRPRFMAQSIASLAQLLTLEASGAVRLPVTEGEPARR